MVTTLIPVQKRGGMRKAVKKRPVKVTPANLFLNKNPNLNIPKKLTDYRYVISTNFTSDEMCSLILFSGWVKANEKLFDAHTTFPIYSIITNKKEMGIEFLDTFAELFEWNSPEVDMKPQYISSLKRVWGFGEENIEASPNNLIYLNFANYPLKNDIPITFGGNRGLLVPELSFLTPDSSPKFFELLSTLTPSDDEGESERPNVPSLKMINMMQTIMYNEADSISGADSDGNIIPLKSQYYILGMVGVNTFNYIPFSGGIRMVIKNKEGWDGWLDTTLEKVFFDL